MTKKDVLLPTIIEAEMSVIDQITSALSVPRDVLAGNDEISQVWTQLPRYLKNVPIQYRNDLLARLCVAARVGLFDASVNYIWNIGIVALRDRVRTFGLNIVAQLRSKDFSETEMVSMQDADLLELCLELNLLSEEGYFFLDQCRSIRNSFSAAHPATGTIDDAELIVFVSRVVKYALNLENNLQGVDVTALVKAVKGEKFSDEQSRYWHSKTTETFAAQVKSILSTVHGIYCDPQQKQEARLNALEIAKGLKDRISANIIIDIVTRHSEYVGSGEAGRHGASTEFFRELGILEYLNEHEKHQLIHKSCRSLLSAHLGFNNFYNEPPYAERLFEVSQQIKIPDSIKSEFVLVNTMGAIGNGYGVSVAAYSFYEKMIKNFSPKEVGIMFEMISTIDSRLHNRLKMNKSCQENFKRIVQFLDSQTVPPMWKNIYQDWLS